VNGFNLNPSLKRHLLFSLCCLQAFLTLTFLHYQN